MSTLISRKNGWEFPWKSEDPNAGYDPIQGMHFLSWSIVDIETLFQRSSSMTFATGLNC